MLVLSRRCDEKNCLSLLGHHGAGSADQVHQIKIGIEAPTSVTILREELDPESFRADENLGANSHECPAVCRKG